MTRRIGTKGTEVPSKVIECVDTARDRSPDVNSIGHVSDSDLVRRAREGDQEAFKEIYERYKDKVFNTAVRLSGDLTEAADIVQEIFIKVYRKLDSFRCDSSFSTWLYRISVNAGIDYQRRRQRHNAAFVDLEEFPGELSGSRDIRPSEYARLREMEERLQGAICKLNPKHRAVVVLRHFQNLSCSEISGILRCPEGTVKSRLNRAYKALRPLLEDVKDKL